MWFTGYIGAFTSGLATFAMASPSAGASYTGDGSSNLLFAYPLWEPNPPPFNPIYQQGPILAQ